MSKLPHDKPKRAVAKEKSSMPSAPRSLKIEEWSPVDQLAWTEAIRPAVRLQRGGAAAHLAQVSQKDIANRYGLYLDFLQPNGLLDPAAAAAELVVLNNVQQFVVELKIRVSSVP